jgi:hypothetical protein
MYIQDSYDSLTWSLIIQYPPKSMQHSIYLPCTLFNPACFSETDVAGLYLTEHAQSNLVCIQIFEDLPSNL